MNDVAMKLPLRLIPRKIGAVFRSLFFLFFFVFSIFWMTMATVGVMTGGMEDEPFQGFRYVFPLFGLPFLLIGLVGMASAIVKLLPGSRYYHVEISAQGLRARRNWKIQQLGWSEISPFGLTVKTRSTKGGKVKTYWVVALRAADTSLLTDESERYKRSVLQINTGDYVNMDVEQAASVLVDWLNGIRAEAIDRPGRAVSVIAVPPEFRDVARPVGSGAGPGGARAAPEKRSSVIER
jgi:hypothetical protein